MFPASQIPARLAATAERARHAPGVAELRGPVQHLCSRMEALDPSIQFNSLMLAAAVSAQALGLDPHDELSRALRKVPASEGPHTIHVQALRDYCRGELARYHPKETTA